MSCSAEQLCELLNFLDDHKDLARGLLRSADGRLRARRLWQELTQHLNSLGGSLKTVQQWQKETFERKSTCMTPSCHREKNSVIDILLRYES